MLHPITKKSLSFKLTLFIFFATCQSIILSGCQSIDSTSNRALVSQYAHLEARFTELSKREAALLNREETVTTRESQIATLFSELLEQKKQLERLQASHQASKITPIPRSNTQTKPTGENQQKQANKTSNSNKTTPLDSVTILGELEYVYLDPPGINLAARIDTGAQTSSLNALDMVEFERDGKPYIKFNIVNPETNEKVEITRRVRGHTKIKKHESEAQRRPIVRLRIKLGKLDEQISFTLVNRSKFKQQVLIGRNFLRDLAIVDVSKEFTQPQIASDTE